MDKQERIEQFNGWVFEMDDAIDDFKKSLPAAIAAKLDYSLSSLDVLEEWLLHSYPSHELLLEQNAANTVDGLARYIGETFRKNIGGVWTIDLDNPKNAYYNLPVLSGFKAMNSPVCPHTLTTTTVHRRTGNFLSTILSRLVENQQVNH